MKYALLLFIKFYWILIPATKRRHCLFQESCSKYVYRITNEKGFLKGMKALLFRYKFCRPGNRIIEIEDEEFLVTQNYKILKTVPH